MTSLYFQFKIVLLSLIFFSIPNKMSAQGKSYLPLDSVLHDLEIKYNVLFTYANENIANIQIKITKHNKKLTQWLALLEKQSGLKFTQIDSRYIAIQKISSIPTQDFNDSVLLTSNRYWIKEVTINYIATGMDKLRNGSIQLNTQNMETLPGLAEPDILKSIQVLPGIQSINETVANINIRGGTNDQNLVLWDGIKMYQTGHFFGLISAFNSHLIYQTTIIKNGTSAYFGEGVSGTIDLKLQDFGVKKWSLNAGINMISSDVITKIPVTKKLTVILGFRNSINNIIQTPTYKNYFKRAFDYTQVVNENDSNSITSDKSFSFNDLTTKIIYTISDKDNICASLLKIKNRIDYSKNYNSQDETYNSISKLEQQNILSTIKYSHQWNERHNIQLSPYLSFYQLDGKGLNEEYNQIHLQKNEVKDWGIKINGEYHINPSAKIQNGYQFIEIGIRNVDNIQQPNYYRDAKDVLRIHALYTEAELQNILKNLYCKFGIRANYIPKFKKLQIEPRLVLNYELKKSVFFEFLAEKKSQYTTQQIDYQDDFLGIEKRRWVLSNNETVPVLNSSQYSFGIQYQPKSFLLSLEAYSKQVSQIISPSQAFLNQYQYIYSIGKYSTNGIECLINKDFAKTNIWCNYTIASNKYNFNEFSPPTFPNNIDIRHSLSIGANYSYKKIKISGGMNYRTGIPYTKPSPANTIDNTNILYEEANKSRLKNYLRVDLSARYDFNIHKIKGEIGAAVWNVFNRKNEISSYYQRNDSYEIKQVTRYALGITPNFNVRIHF